MSTPPPAAQDRFKLRSVAFFGRTLAEYLQMFALDAAELRGRKILDVASGPGSFVAEALALGLDATGCEPIYAQDAATIAPQGKRDIDACREQIRANPGVLAYRDIETFYGEKYAALERLAADFQHRSGESRYIVGALPALPFADGAFDLVLSATAPRRWSTPRADANKVFALKFPLSRTQNKRTPTGTQPVNSLVAARDPW